MNERIINKYTIYIVIYKTEIQWRATHRTYHMRICVLRIRHQNLFFFADRGLNSASSARDNRSCFAFQNGLLGDSLDVGEDLLTHTIAKFLNNK